MEEIPNEKADRTCPVCAAAVCPADRLRTENRGSRACRIPDRRNRRSPPPKPRQKPPRTKKLPQPKKRPPRSPRKNRLPPEPALPDGVYTAEFNTDSSMFHANEACDGKGTLTVKDGSMTIHVSLASKSIVNLFYGPCRGCAEGRRGAAAAHDRHRHLFRRPVRRGLRLRHPRPRAGYGV